MALIASRLHLVWVATVCGKLKTDFRYSNTLGWMGSQLGAFIARDKVHLVAMTGSYFRGDSEAVLVPADEARFETITYTYYEQLNGYNWLKSLDIGYFFYTGPYVDAVAKVLDPALKSAFMGKACRMRLVAKAAAKGGRLVRVNSSGDST